MAAGPGRQSGSPFLRRAREALGGDPAPAEPAPAGQHPSSSTGSGLRQSVAAASERIQEIIDVAERLAEEIKTEAEAEARRLTADAMARAEAEAEQYLDQRRSEADRLVQERANELSRLTDSLTEQGERLKAEAGGMAQQLESVVQQLRGSGPAAAPAPTPVAPAVAGPQPIAYPGTAAPTAEDEPAPSGEVSEEALLRATQMAVAGSAREEIVLVLQSEFGLADPALIVDDVLGSGE